MSILVAYASRYGATQGIAERIAQVLSDQGMPAEARPAQSVVDPERYDAFVVGSALYMFHWQKDALRFVRQHHAVLARKPVWLFSSGPLGTETVDATGKDVRDSAGPQELEELRSATGAREHRVFFGALDVRKLRGVHRVMTALPASKKLFIEGDFRDWGEIDAWAVEIARALTNATNDSAAAAVTSVAV